MTGKIYTTLILLFSMGFLPTHVAAQGAGEVMNRSMERFFSQDERDVIQNYYRARDGKLVEAEDDDDDDHRKGNKDQKNNNNNNKQKGLPKGIRMKLERGGTLPPGHAKRYLSCDLERQLPPVPDGYERTEIDGQVVLIDVVSGVITDIIDIVTDTNTGAGNNQLMSDRSRITADAIKEEPDKKWWQFWKD